MEWISIIKRLNFSVPAFHVSTSYPGSRIPIVVVSNLLTTNMYFLHREGYTVTSYSTQVKDLSLIN